MKAKLFVVSALLFICVAGCQKPIFEDSDVKHLVSNIWFGDKITDTNEYYDYFYNGYNYYDGVNIEYGDTIFRFVSFDKKNDTTINYYNYIVYGKDNLTFNKISCVDYKISKLKDNRIEFYRKYRYTQYSSRVQIYEHKFYIDVNSDNFVITTVIYKLYYEDTGEIIYDYDSYQSTYTIAPKKFADEIRKL